MDSPIKTVDVKIVPRKKMMRGASNMLNTSYQNTKVKKDEIYETRLSHDPSHLKAYPWHYFINLVFIQT